MSNNRAGLAAAVNLEERIMIPNDPIAPNAESVYGGARDILTMVEAKQRPKRTKVNLGARVDQWIMSELNKRVHESNAKGNSLVKEDLVALCIVQGLGLTPPEGWDIHG